MDQLTKEYLEIIRSESRGQKRAEELIKNNTCKDSNSAKIINSK